MKKESKIQLYSSIVSLFIYHGFPTRIVHLYYISCLKYTILAGNPRYMPLCVCVGLVKEDKEWKKRDRFNPPPPPPPLYGSGPPPPTLSSFLLSCRWSADRSELKRWWPRLRAHVWRVAMLRLNVGRFDHGHFGLGRFSLWHFGHRCGRFGQMAYLLFPLCDSK